MITRAILWTLAVLIGWGGVLAGVMLFSDAAPAALVLLPGPDLLQQLPEGTAILSRTALTVTLISEAPGFAADLYRAGALLVLPAGLLGCAPLTS